jgi:hypothetical protein
MAIEREGGWRCGQDSVELVTALLRNAARCQIVFLVKEFETFQPVRAEGGEGPPGENRKSARGHAPPPRMGCCPISHLSGGFAGRDFLEDHVAHQPSLNYIGLCLKDGEAEPVPCCPTTLLGPHPPRPVSFVLHGRARPVAQSGVPEHLDECMNVLHTPGPKNKSGPGRCRARMQCDRGVHELILCGGVIYQRADTPHPRAVTMTRQYGPERGW